MDILFSPYGVGSMPKPVMAEVERRTEDLLRSSSFQRMLELEKKYKMERLRGVSPLLQSSQFPAQLKDGPPPRPERPDSLFPQDAPLMLKAARRTVPLPSLSITIPQSAPSEQPGRPGLGGIEQETEEHSGAATPTNGEPFHKQVKFLAPEDGDDDDEDAMSEQSSICQSPSWEGYGQRKKEKKLEAERRKKEKEQAEKEAKAARKRSSARLSKAPPPPPTTGRDSRPAGLTSADRSISEPLLATPHQLQSAQAAHRPEDVGRAFSVDDLQHSGQKRPALPDVLSGSGFDAGRLAGGPVRDPYSPSIPHDLPYDGTVGPQQDLRRSFSEGPAAPSQQSPPTSASRPDGRSSRDAFPPSASRTPKLRHMSPSGNSRSNSLLQGVASSNRSQESLSAVPSSEGSRRDGYVRYQRAQAAERAMAGLADEQLVCPPTRSSSIQSQHTRRSSLTQEAKSVAMKLVGVRARDDGSKSNRGGRESDYLTFKAIPYSASLAEAPVPVRSAPASPKSRDGAPQTRADERPSSSEMAALRKADGHHEDCSALERPPTSQSSVSSGGPSASGSVPSSHSKRGRSLRDAAKAALSISKGPQRPANNARSSSSIPPYLALRARMHSRASVRTEDNTLGAPADKAPAVAVKNSAATTSHLVSGERTETTGGQSANCRASEGSSSSSAYEEGSPLPSPTTTPDTSRPQSAKDVPLPAGEFTRENKETLGLQDDERTLRQSLDSSNSSTPRLGDSEPRESVEVGNEDRWSRTALPIDIDCDAESFITSVSNLENLADPDQGLSSLPSALHTSSHTPEATHSESAAADPTLSIPPRSRRRDNTAAEGSARSSNATSPARERRDGDSGSLQDNAGTTGDKERNIVLGGSSHSRTSSGPAKYSEGEEADETGERTLGRHKKRQQQKPTKTEAVEQRLESERAKEEEAIQVAASQAARNISRHNRTSGSVSSASSTIPSAGSTSRAASPGLGSDFPIPSNPYFTDMAEAAKEHDHAIEAPSSAGSPSPISLPSPLQQAAPKPLGPPRAYSAPTPPSASAAPSRASTPSARSSGTAPVSILKQPKTTLAGGGGDPASSSRPPPPAVLSALPKHMQMQAGMAAVAAARGPGNNNSTAVVVASPLAKMFVECCSCRFYHDMPSKLYECMARPDAVVEDKALGISGAITTMVKCPWCQHNMSRNCCAGYAAVVYLKEKLH